MNERTTDRELVARAQRGDSRAFGVLMKKYRPRLARLLSRFVRDPAEVEDVMQEAFLIFRAREALAEQLRPLLDARGGARW